ANPNLGYSFYSFRYCFCFPSKRYHWYQSEAGSGGIGPSAVKTIHTMKGISLSPRRHLRRQQPQKHIPYHQRLVLSRTSHQCVRPLKPVRSLALHFPIVVCPRPHDGPPPVSSSVTQSMFNERLNFSPDRRITCVMQLNRNSHFCLFYKHTSRAALSAPLLSPTPPTNDEAYPWPCILTDRNRPAATFRSGRAFMSYQQQIPLMTKGHGDMHNITEEVATIVTSSGIRTGTVNVFNLGSSAAVGTIEFEQGLQHDLPAILDRLIPPSRTSGHEQAWQAGNGPSHLQASGLAPF